MKFTTQHCKHFLLASLVVSCSSAFSTIASSGGRPPTKSDYIINTEHPTTTTTTDASNTNKRWQATPPAPDEAKLTIVQVTDVYTLKNFAHIKTLLKETRETMGDDDSRVISVLTGDFLAPYLLSSVDRGNGMMNALSKTPIDYLTWGNHEADIAHKTVCRHVRNFPGTFINTNMQDHEAMDAQTPFDIVEVRSPDGTQVRKIGLVAVLSDDPELYSHFKAPGAFGGATIRDPWETLKEYKDLLESEPHNCDLVIPLQHLYVPDDHKTCEQFDFPVVLSGHDHHKVDEVHCGTRLIKPGQDADFAAVVDICWRPGDAEPTIESRFVKTQDWEADEQLQRENERAYEALSPLRDTELARVPLSFEPLSSVNARGQVTTMGKFICSLLRSSLNVQRGRQRNMQADAVLLMGGNIRGSKEYDFGSFFSLEALEAEVKDNEVVGVVHMPGWVLAAGIEETHAGDPIPGWLQYDNLIAETVDEDGVDRVTHVGGTPIDMNKIYRVATKVPDLTNGQSPTFTKYFTEHPEALPRKGAYVNIHSELMSYFARNLWRKLWEATDLSFSMEDRFNKFDLNGDGVIDVYEIQSALQDLLGLSVHDDELSLAEVVESFADITDDGEVTINDFYQFEKEIPLLFESDKWRLAFTRPPKVNIASFIGTAQQQRKVDVRVAETVGRF